MRSSVINVKLFLGFQELEFIGSREAGEKIRAEMDERYRNGDESVTLDFLGIEDITQSFADELVGIYARSFGLDFVRNKIKLNNANQSIKDTFNFVCSYSKIAGVA